jgi:hypothetical protein
VMGVHSIVVDFVRISFELCNCMQCRTVVRVSYCVVTLVVFSALYLFIHVF